MEAIGDFGSIIHVWGVKIESEKPVYGWADIRKQSWHKKQNPRTKSPKRARATRGGVHLPHWRQGTSLLYPEEEGPSSLLSLSMGVKTLFLRKEPTWPTVRCGKTCCYPLVWVLTVCLVQSSLTSKLSCLKIKSNKNLLQGYFKPMKIQLSKGRGRSLEPGTGSWPSSSPKRSPVLPSSCFS